MAAKVVANVVAKKAVLQLEDGTVYDGFSFGYEASVAGECVFQTGMVGYPESLTDPSYRGQLLVLTFPLIGNYGVPPHSVDSFGLLEHFESEQIHVKALLVGDYCHQPSHWNSAQTLSDWLISQKIPALFGLDTRAITKRIRDKGSMLAKIIFNNEDIQYSDPNQVNLVAEVSCKAPKLYTVPGADKTIIFVDCGMKLNQLRCLLRRGVNVKVVPWNYDISKEKGIDGVFISNGPGDPIQCQKTIQEIRTLINSPTPIPIFGIPW